MNSFRKLVEDYLKQWPNNPAIVSFDFINDIIQYAPMRNNRNISKLPGDEEYVRAYIVTKLVNELGYDIADIEFEKEYSIGRSCKKKAKARIDIVVYKPHSKDIFMFIELKAPDKYKKEREKAIEEQLYSLAAQEISSSSNKIDYLVYCSLNELDCSERITLIDFKKFDKFAKWSSSPDYHTKLLPSYNNAPSSTTKREFGVNDVDNRIEGVISSLNQHIKYNEVKDSLLFVNTCILALFNDQFRKDVINGIYDSDSTETIINEMMNNIVKNGGEIDNYQFANTNNKKSVTALIKATCTSMKSKKELDSKIYSLLDFLKDLGNKIFPIILLGCNEDKLLISETIYKYIYIHKNGKNSVISTPANITNFMVKLLDLKEEDFFVEFCSGFGNFTLSYLLHIINNYNHSPNGNKVSGIESEDYIYLFYITTLRIIGLNLIQALNGDMFKLNNIKELIHSYNSKYKVGACMNPPFGGKDNKVAAKLVLKGCELLPKGSLFAVILPYAFAIGNSKQNGFDAAQFHNDLLKNNTLLASFSLADGTFGAAASTVVTALLIKTGISHFKKAKNGKLVLKNGSKIPNEKTYLLYCKDDGYKILKNTRVEKKKGLGEEKIKTWLSDYQTKKIDPLKSIYEYIHDDDEWLIEAYMKTDYSILTEQHFKKTIRDFYGFKIMNGGK